MYQVNNANNIQTATQDRRPIDPPPIIDLKIFEGEGEYQRDITFLLNANYFLVVSLELASTPPPEPVLTPGSEKPQPNLAGVPIASLVYLDRPSPAGYFIFQDLSIRHEGKYRLVFNLFETLKDPQDDDVQDGLEHASFPSAAHVTGRIEVKSKIFTVYSAKKFPGLASSTELSKTLADQGCRVRIRRDVRQKKKEKHGQQEEEAVGEMYTNPAAQTNERHRSSSRGHYPPLLPSPPCSEKAKDSERAPRLITRPDQRPTNSNVRSNWTTPPITQPFNSDASMIYPDHRSSMRINSTQYIPSRSYGFTAEQMGAGNSNRQYTAMPTILPSQHARLSGPLNITSSPNPNPNHHSRPLNGRHILPSDDVRPSTSSERCMQSPQSTSPYPDPRRDSHLPHSSPYHQHASYSPSIHSDEMARSHHVQRTLPALDTSFTTFFPRTHYEDSSAATTAFREQVSHNNIPSPAQSTHHDPPYNYNPTPRDLHASSTSSRTVKRSHADAFDSADNPPHSAPRRQSLPSLNALKISPRIDSNAPTIPSSSAPYSRFDRPPEPQESSDGILEYTNDDNKSNGSLLMKNELEHVDGSARPRSISYQRVNGTMAHVTFEPLQGQWGVNV